MEFLRDIQEKKALLRRSLEAYTTSEQWDYALQSINTVDDWNTILETDIWRGNPTATIALARHFHTIPTGSNYRDCFPDFWIYYNELQSSIDSNIPFSENNFIEPKEEPMDYDDDDWMNDEPKGNYICNKVDLETGKVCRQRFDYDRNRTRHILQFHKKDSILIKCDKCSKKFASKDSLHIHKCAVHNECRKEDFVQGRETSRHLQTYRYWAKKHSEDYVAYFEDFYRKALPFLQAQLKNGSLKFQISSNALFEATDKIDVHHEFSFCNASTTIFNVQNLEECLQDNMTEQKKRIDEFIGRGVASKLRFESMVCTDVIVYPYNPTSRGRFGSYIRTPREISNPKCSLLNITAPKNDNNCFLYCIAAANNPATKHVNRHTSYEMHISDYKLNEKITFPITLEGIKEFEDINPQIKINVYIWKNGEIHQYRLSDKGKEFKSINLLLLQKGRKKHFCLIKNLASLISKQTGKNTRKLACEKCLSLFTNLSSFVKHEAQCSTGKSKILMPLKNSFLRFKNYHHQLSSYLTIVGDFESFLRPTEEFCGDNSVKIHEHLPNSFGAVCIETCGCETEEDKYTGLVVKKTDTAGLDFLQQVYNVGKRHQKRMDKVVNRKLKFTKEEKNKYYRATDCNICSLPLNTARKDVASKRVRDHCHRCGKFRGAAHQICNLKLRESRNITVFFHNLRGYDGHILMDSMARFLKSFPKKRVKINCIAKSMEDYLTFVLTFKRKRRREDGRPVRVKPKKKETKEIVSEKTTKKRISKKTKRKKGRVKYVHWKLRFIDSYSFLHESLSGLVNLLAKDGMEKFNAMKKFIPDESSLKLLLRKGVYPYEFMTDSQKFEISEILKKENFINDGEEISEEDYAHYLKVHHHFGIEKFWDYHALYLKTDVLLLADVIQNFRKRCLKNYGLDPVYYVSLASYSWDCMLKYTRARLEQMTDQTMYEFFTKGVRGGMSVISHRLAIANNPELHRYDPRFEISYIGYFDANNLYGWSMSQNLPVRGFRWMTNEELNDPNFEEIIMAWKNTDLEGCVLEVDLEYPPELHDKHCDFPLAPEKLIIKESMLSPYALRIMHETQMKFPQKGIEKLCATFYDRKHYILHYRLLKLYLSLGMKLTKVHRGVKFTQTDWLSPYIKFNTKKRIEADSDFEAGLVKEMNNSIYGKTIQNQYQQKDVRLEYEDERIRKLIRDPRHQMTKLFSDNLHAICLAKKIIKLDRPIYAGFAILEFSKELMYDFHYGLMKPWYGDRIKLLFTDTDSLCYHIRTENLDDDLKTSDLGDSFDFSNYPREHTLFDESRKMVPGRFKDELKGKTKGSRAIGFVGLRAKMYSILMDDMEEKKRAKGIKRKVAKNELTFRMYLETLFDSKITSVFQQTIRSDAHKLFTIRTRKKGLSPYDDKRFLINNIESVPYGYNGLKYVIEEAEME